MAVARVKTRGITINNLGISIPDASYFVCDTYEDLQNLPYDPVNAAAGSIAIVLGYKEPNDIDDIRDDKSHVNEGGGKEASVAYMMGASGIWIKYTGVSIIQ